MDDLTITARREFLVKGLGLVGVAPALPNLLVKTALAADDTTAYHSVLVVL